jgi:hypothetical protein
LYFSPFLLGAVQTVLGTGEALHGSHFVVRVDSPFTSGEVVDLLALGHAVAFSEIAAVTTTIFRQEAI